MSSDLNQIDLNKIFLYEGNELNFFQAVYLLEKLFLGKGRLGTTDDMASEPMRIETLNTLGFPSSEIHAILPPLSFQKQAAAIEAGNDKNGPTEETVLLPPILELLDANEGPLRIVVTFMGLYGVSSPLPSYFVDPITLKKIQYFELKKFLDIFTHRLYSFYYRSWKKYRHSVQFNPAGPDDYTLRLLALTGQWPKRQGRARGLGQGAEFNLRRIPYARFLGNRVRSAKGLQQLLRGYFGFTKVKINQFVPSWVEIPVKANLGTSPVRLGISMRIGDLMLDQMSRFTVEIGPMPKSIFNRFVPKLPGASDEELEENNTSLLVQVQEMIDAYLRDPLDYQIKIILDPSEQEAPVLGTPSARMGMGLWLGARPQEEIACRF